MCLCPQPAPPKVRWLYGVSGGEGAVPWGRLCAILLTQGLSRPSHPFPVHLRQKMPCCLWSQTPQPSLTCCRV